MVDIQLLFPDEYLPPVGTLEADFCKLQELLEDHVPASVLVRLDEPSSHWLAVHYVPDSATIRDKMLYALTRNLLTKNLGSTHFADTIFATSKDDVTPAAYAAHKRHVAAEAPMSAKEKEMADVREAERQAGGGAYEGSRGRQNHIGTGVGLNWTAEVEDAVKDLASSSRNRLVVLTVDPATETLMLSNAIDCTVEELGEKLSPSEPSYAFFAWPQEPPYTEIVFIYSCPSTSPVKHRMLYSSGSSSVYQSAKQLLLGARVASRKIETSDPKELNAAFLRTELGTSNDGSRSGTPVVATETKAFARPRGPAKRR
ncbi:hypothetical protein EW146_g712 [Bondarzewia mesenterica]|uniref:ADF-H domain-containing protein n=1 Tax=Bondarzewia mesenterica TaxID=1095465 RepID=A0A4S4MCB8_9AGAM|nr:hypothetical protein EW146_g712 [Bondarzewia mesenterica]